MHISVDYDRLFCDALQTFLSPTRAGAGDAIQAMKAGLLEVGDIYVVNKANLPGAEQMVQELDSVLGSPRGKIDINQQ